MQRYQVWKIEITKMGERSAQWTFAQSVITGTEFEYAVKDRNYTSRNAWEFLVRIPRHKNDPIEVRPRRVPNIRVWAGLERRSVTFSRATQASYRGKYYAKVTLADPTENKTKKVVRFKERAKLPRWFDAFGARLRRKNAVTSTRGRDGHHLVCVFRADDHQGMIGLFFASKVWVLGEGFELSS